ncbi:MAG TPA: SDR family NAD(P)-dependent oxidoreductase [Paludibacter sp.]
MKKAIIVGATSGIGRSLAKLLVENNYKVGTTGRRSYLLEQIKTENPDSYYIKTFDITQTQSIENHLNELTQELDGLDLLVISSGTGDINIRLDFEIEKCTIDTNVSGFTAIADWAFNYFRKQKHGQLVGISSIAGLRGNRQAPSYSATKAYQITYLEGLRLKAVKTALPIFITDIRPGFVDTEMAKGEGLFWVASVDKAAKQIYKAIQCKRKIVYVTKRWRWIACLMKHAPNWIFERL